MFVTVGWDDSQVFGRPILNPSVAYYHDVDDIQAGVLIFEIEHPLVLAEYGAQDCIILKDMVVTPSARLMIDHRYYDKAGVGGTGGIGTRMGYLEYGLDVTLDLTSALNMPKQFGIFTVGGFLNFVQPFHDESPLVNDQLYGGLKVGWEF